MISAYQLWLANPSPNMEETGQNPQTSSLGGTEENHHEQGSQDTSTTQEEEDTGNADKSPDNFSVQELRHVHLLSEPV
ncbi:uncharacterized protein [Miscanthus floridulus]|uniref:uncharacterized protein isoform X2 n=1 Tax=Miscanthus floridulus TaxID=154761 RepID=UPI003457994A